MSTPAILNFEDILKPIEGENPVGGDLRADSSPRSTYYAIRDARNQARTAERQAQMNGESPQTAGNWSPLVTAIPQVLSGTSKDLEFAAYLIEALARTNGFAGLRDGFHVARELVNLYGDQIYPQPDEDGLETRLSPLTGLNGADGEGTLIGPIRNIPLTDHAVGDFSTASYEQALDLERASPETRQNRISQGAVALATIQAAIAQTSAAYVAQLWQDLEECIDEYNQYVRVLDDKYGHDAPPSSNIQNALTRCREVIKALAPEKIPSAQTEAAADPAQPVAAATGGKPQAAAASGGAAPGTIGPIQTRDDAFRQLQQIALYFKQTEPHTPITYAIEQVVRWGKMPLPELLRELIPDPSSVQQMFRLVGIPQEQ